MPDLTHQEWQSKAASLKIPTQAFIDGQCTDTASVWTDDLSRA